MIEASGKKKGKIQTDFHGLIELLAKNLYPQEDMFVRELVQNGHDSIVVRGSLEAPPPGRIDILADRDARTIVFQDNGAGMTEKQIKQYLATIGRSGTRELRDQFAQGDRERAQSLIGQFGIGILSGFVAAERIVVETRSAGADAGGLRWTVSGGPDWEMEPMEKDESGTTVTLHLKSEYLGMTNPKILQEAVRKYADFLPFPIYVNGQGPVNTMQAPWHRDYPSDKERHKAYFHWVDGRFPDVPLEIIPVEMDAPHPVKGVLYISDRHMPDVDMAGMVDIFQARMFIRQGDRSMLPLWAKFVRGVIDSPALTPTAARDAVQQDAVHDEIRNALGHLIIDRLKRMAKEDRRRFRRLLEWHHYHIKGMAVQFDDFFEAIADTVIFEVNRPDPEDPRGGFEMVTLPEYCRLQQETDEGGRKIVYFISEQGAAPQFYRLCEAKGLLAINAGLVFEEAFLEKYAKSHPEDVALQRVDIAEGTAIFEPLSEEERLKYVDLEYRLNRHLRVSLPDQETVVRTERFAPEEIPAVLTETEDVEVAQRLQQLAVHPGMSSAQSDAIREVLGIQQARLRPVVLHLNAASDVIDRLRQEDFNDPVIQDAWMAVYNNAFMYSRHVLSAQNLEVLHAQTIRALENVLKLREERRKLEIRISILEEPQPGSEERLAIRRTNHVSLFVMMPFGDEYDVLEGALREVLEDDPYNFQVVLARDRTLDNDLFENVKAHMRLVHGFLAEVSDLNPNVMLEMGITEIDPEERPVIMLRRTDGEDLPADLKHRLYLQYDLPPRGDPDPVRALAEQFRKKLPDNDFVEGLCKNRTARYLSATHLRRELDDRLNEEEAKTLCKAFSTLEELVEADQAAIEEKTKLDRLVIAMVKAKF